VLDVLALPCDGELGWNRPEPYAYLEPRPPGPTLPNQKGRRIRSRAKTFCGFSHSRCGDRGLGSTQRYEVRSSGSTTAPERHLPSEERG
jgi:hypothetical protein